MGRERISQYQPDLAIPPGETLQENLAALGIPIDELALRMGRSADEIRGILKGRSSITPEVALELETVFGAPASFWINLQGQYEETLARLRAQDHLHREAAAIRTFPYAEMAELGWVPRVRDKVARVRALLSFFGITSLDSLPAVEKAAYRRSYGRKPSREALAAWLRQGLIEARAMDTEPCSEPKIRESVPDLRRLTRQRPEQFQRELRAICACCGVAVVLVPHLRKTYANGAVYWLGPQKAVVQLSIRWRYDDVFWFTFFHELGHVLLHGRRRTFVDLECMEKSPEDHQADQFAANTLIPVEDFRCFAARGRWSRDDVLEFAASKGIAPSIVVGRLHHERLIPHSHMNDLRTRFRLVPEA